MTISERLFNIMQEKDISMPELSRMTGISRHTIYDWQKKNTNPGADKIMVICEALQISPEELLMGRECDEHPGETQNAESAVESAKLDQQIRDVCREFSDAQKRRLLAYMSMLQNMKK